MHACCVAPDGKKHFAPLAVVTSEKLASLILLTYSWRAFETKRSGRCHLFSSSVRNAQDAHCITRNVFLKLPKKDRASFFGRMGETFRISSILSKIFFQKGIFSCQFDALSRICFYILSLSCALFRSAFALKIQTKIGLKTDLFLSFLGILNNSIQISIA